MPNAIPFVNREEELDELRDGLESDQGEFYAVIGPSGSGKTAILDQFEAYLDQQSILTIRHDIGEPKTEAAFIYRFLESWDESLPNSKWESIKERIADSNSGPILKAAELVDPRVGAGTRILEAVISGNWDDKDLNREISEVDFLLNILQDAPDEDIVVIIDQFDDRRLFRPIVKDLDRTFREISKNLPKNFVWCIGADHEIGRYEGDITHISLGSLDSDAIDTLIDEIGLEIGEAESDSPPPGDQMASYITEITNFDGPNLTKRGLIDEIKERTGGDPYILSLLVQTVRDEDISLAIRDFPMHEDQVRDHLEERLLARLDHQQEALLRDVCILQQFDSRTAAQVSGNTPAQTRRMLENLNEMGIIRKVQRESAGSRYRCHDLIREFLQRDLIEARGVENRGPCLNARIQGYENFFSIQVVPDAAQSLPKNLIIRR